MFFYFEFYGDFRLKIGASGNVVLLILVRLFKSNNKIYYFINQYITSKPNPFLSYIKDTQKSAPTQLFHGHFRPFSTE